VAHLKYHTKLESEDSNAMCFPERLPKGASMRIVIGGAGEVGRGVAKALRSEGRDVVLIDSNPAAIKEAQALDVLVVQGDATIREDLMEAEIERAEVYIAATERDEINLLSCSLARDICSSSSGDGRDLMTIARIHDAKLVSNEDKESLARWTGVNHPVCSDLIVIKDLKAGLKGSGMNEVLSLGNDAWVAVVQVQPSAEQLINHTILDAEDRVDGLPRIFGVKVSGEGSKIPTESTVITEHSLLAFATVGKHTFRRILEAAGHDPAPYPKSPRVLIFGATRLGRQIARSYLEEGCRVTVISESLEEANALAGSEYGDTDLLDSIHGDPLDSDLLQELDIENHDISIAALKDDQTNIAVSLQAAELGIERTGMVLDDSQMAQVARRIGETYAVSRRRIAINYILRQVHNRVEGNYHLLASVPELVGMSASVGSGNKMIGRQIKKLEGNICRVAFVQRSAETGSESMIRATPDLFLKEGDRLMLFAKVKDIENVEDLLSGS